MVVKEFNIQEAAKQYQSAQPFPNIIEEGQKHNSVWAARNHPNDINVNELKK